MPTDSVFGFIGRFSASFDGLRDHRGLYQVLRGQTETPSPRGLNLIMSLGWSPPPWKRGADDLNKLLRHERV